MIDRRRLLQTSAALVSTVAFPIVARAETAKLRVASVKFGSLGWLLETIKAEGLDKAAGFEFEIVDLATSQASPVALLGGSADIVVNDWTWALRQRAQGEAMKFAPYSTALGAIMVPNDSPYKTLTDLEGKKLGVAGSSLDKSWLLLRAYSKKTTGKDIGEITRPVYGAAPLLAEQMKDGQLDAVLNFWTYSARLSGAGFRELISMADVMKALEVEPVPSMVGFIWKESTEAALGPSIMTFLKVIGEGNVVLAKSDPAWERLRPLVKPANDAEFAAIKAYYRSGIPGPWRDGDMKSAEKIMHLLVNSGGTELVGNGTRFDPKLFHTAGA